MPPPRSRTYHNVPGNFTNWPQSGYPHGFNGYRPFEHPHHSNWLPYKAPVFCNNGAGPSSTPMQDQYEATQYPRQLLSDTGPLMPYGCHCAQCTHHAETGWSTFMDQGAMAPIQYSQPPAQNMTLPQQYGRHYHEPHHTASSTCRLAMPATSFHNIDASPPGVDPSHSITSETSEAPSLVAPPEIFGHPSPVPTLSDCSTGSMSSGLRSLSTWGDISDMPLYSVYGYGPGNTWSTGPASSVWTTMPPVYQDNDIPQVSSTERSFASSKSVNSSSRCSPMEPRRNYQAQPNPTHRIGDIGSSITDVPADAIARHEQFFSTSHSRDQLLVRWKLAGMSYKQIKAKGHFKEAESTLRGRFRALTKNPGERVRKPRWTKRDVRLLREGVQKLSAPTMSYRTAPANLRSASSSSRRKSKMQRRQQVIKLRTPWKEVADYISDQGGSYHFGNATCRKKWDEVTAEDEAAVNNAGSDVDTETDAGERDADGSEGEDGSMDDGNEVDEEEEDLQDD